MIAAVSALSAAASLGLLGSDMSSIPGRIFPQNSLCNAQAQASCLVLGSLLCEISKLHAGDNVKVLPKWQWCYEAY